MDKTIVSKLRDIGLSEKESMLYLVLLTLRQAGVTQVSKAAKVGRSTAYVILDSLSSKGFATIKGGEESLQYVAVEPEELIRTAEAIVAKESNASESAHEVATRLESMMAEAANAPRATYLDNSEGLQTLRDEIESAARKTPLKAFLHSTSHVDTLLINPTGVQAVIAIDAQEYRDHRKLDRVEIRFIPKERYPFVSDFFIFSNTIILISDAEEFAVRIESKEFTNVINEAFALAWEETERLDAKLSMSAKRNSSKR